MRTWHRAAVTDYRAGRSTVEIAARLGLSVATVARHIRSVMPPGEYRERKRVNHRIAARALIAPGTLARHAAIIEMYRQTSLTSHAIATRVGMSPGGVNVVLREGIPADEFRRLRRTKRSLGMLGNKRGLGHKKTAVAMRVYRDRWGEKNPHWKGGAATKYTGHSRAARRFPIADQTCARCGVPAQVRHHRDEDTHNNVPENIEFMCRACHMRHHRH